MSSCTLPVTVRYPTVGVAGAGEYVDASPAGSAPLIVFAHGFDTTEDTYRLLLHDLAAAGFIVAAPDFPLSTSAASGSPVEGDEGEQAGDISFVIDRLLAGDAGPALTAAVRPGPVGVVGHSDGAVTALLAAFSPAYADDRIGAVVDVSGAFDDYGGRWFTTADPPLLALHGADDELNPVSRDETLVDSDPGAATLVVVDGASHLGTVTGITEPAVARLIVDDLAWRLEGSGAGATGNCTRGELRRASRHRDPRRLNPFAASCGVDDDHAWHGDAPSSASRAIVAQSRSWSTVDRSSRTHNDWSPYDPSSGF